MSTVESLTAATDRREGKYLIFRLGSEQFGLEVLRVREIIGVAEMTEVPQAPPHVRGVINLRGKIIPMLDLRRRFGLQDVELHARTCAVVVETPSDSGDLLVGLIVDGVSEVVFVPGDAVEDAPAVQGVEQRSWILGLAKLEGAVSILLHLEEVLEGAEAEDLNEVVAAVQRESEG